MARKEVANRQPRLAAALKSSKLWDELRRRIQAPYAMEENVRALTRHYEELLAARLEGELVTAPSPATEIEGVRYA